MTKIKIKQSRPEAGSLVAKVSGIGRVDRHCVWTHNVGLLVKHWLTVSGIVTLSKLWNFKTSCMQAQTHHHEELVIKGKWLNLFVLNEF